MHTLYLLVESLLAGGMCVCLPINAGTKIFTHQTKRHVTSKIASGYVYKIGFQSKIWNSKYWINWQSWNIFRTRSLGSGDRAQLEKRREWKFTTKISTVEKSNESLKDKISCNLDFESRGISNSWILFKLKRVEVFLFKKNSNKTGSVTHLCRPQKQQ